MRTALLALLVFCVGGFMVSSGTVSLVGGIPRIETAAVGQALPVLVALAAPMVTVAVGLMLVMLLRRRDGRREMAPATYRPHDDRRHRR